ncbi:MAG: DNA primase [Christensenellaceae bacterium]|jgi:DNA primase|nr:DNA primase [Christensenellaceae bacterium]
MIYFCINKSVPLSLSAVTRCEDQLINHFNSDWVATLKDRIDIVEFLGKYMYVSRAGNKFKACCPFHSEKTPSFIINPAERYYHCFGCGKSGNAITFLMEHERMSYTEALETLAEFANVPLPDRETPDQVNNRRMRETAFLIMKSAAKFYFSSLVSPDGEVARSYLATRKLNADTVKIFGIGYSPDFESLPQHLLENGFTPEMMKYAGLVHDKNGHLTDFFAKRLIIPIINIAGNVVGFGGRILIKDTNLAKYKNSEETPIFQKRAVLFGSNLIKRNQAQEKFKHLILVEGYMDVIALYQAGVHNVVASMGTALHIEQCKALKKLTDIVYVCFDGDTAGQAATWKSLNRLSEFGLDVRVMTLPNGMDPDDTINKLGKKGFQELVDAAQPMYDFMINGTAAQYDLTTAHGARQFVMAAVAILSKMDSIAQDAYINIVSKLSSFATETIRNALHSDQPVIQHKPKDSINPAVIVDAEQIAASGIAIDNALRKCIIAARFVLSMYFFDRKSDILSDLKEVFFEYPPHLTIYQSIVEAHRMNKEIRAGDLYDILPSYSDEVNKIINAIHQVAPAERLKFYKDCQGTLLVRIKDRRIKELLQLLNSVEDFTEKCKLQDELRMLTINKRAHN